MTTLSESVPSQSLQGLSNFTIGSYPMDVAHRKAVQPFLSTAFGSAPLSRRILTALTLNSEAEIINAVAPY